MKEKTPIIPKEEFEVREVIYDPTFYLIGPAKCPGALGVVCGGRKKRYLIINTGILKYVSCDNEPEIFQSWPSFKLRGRVLLHRKIPFEKFGFNFRSWSLKREVGELGIYKEETFDWKKAVGKIAEELTVLMNLMMRSTLGVRMRHLKKD